MTSSAQTHAPLVACDGLTVDFAGPGGRVPAVDDVTLAIAPGECLALVGRSGSGKSVTARALVGLAGPGARVTARRWTVGGNDASRWGPRAWRRIRGREIGLVLQDALVSLDGMRTVGAEVAEPLRAHRIVPRAKTADRVARLLSEVGIPDPVRRAAQYPHQLSGGLRQRALLAAGLAAGPALLIADEPTTALDVTVQAQVLGLLGRLRDAGMGLLLISHDLAAVATVADRVAVLHDGSVVEEGPAARVLSDPLHDRTRELLAAVPSVASRRSAATARPDTGCPTAVPGTVTAPRTEQTAARETPFDGAGPTDAVLLDVRSVTKRYPGPHGERRAAVREVSFRVHAGRTLGIVGASGSGKSTTARLVLGLETPDFGSVHFDGELWSGLAERRRRPLRRQIQFVQQDPLSSLDPRWTVGRLLEEALGVRGVPSGGARRDEAVQLLEQVGLEAAHLARRPAQLSGGQRQRVAFARALAPRPRLLVCDEPVSALDSIVQAQILGLLAGLRRRYGLTMLFISHDLRVVRRLCDHVMVMRDGQVVESGGTAGVFDRPQHPYTRALLDALPDWEPGTRPPCARRTGRSPGTTSSPNW
ncbi:dipeptide ABC transporter ATP-binding protein [Streptomyces noursei]|uniref:dipeptide ABC transporter ATP-binding protein n=1 Tax=Streptomyces noursei TaxID=1971 RepID=UPI0038198D68